ncbi:unnamed protein product, partial [Nesidiocoris tenuis]
MFSKSFPMGTLKAENSPGSLQLLAWKVIRHHFVSIGRKTNGLMTICKGNRIRMCKMAEFTR